MASRHDADVTCGQLCEAGCIISMLLMKRENLSKPTENRADKQQILNPSSSLLAPRPTA